MIRAHAGFHLVETVRCKTIGVILVFLFKYYLVYSLPTVPTVKWTPRALFAYYFPCLLSKALAVAIQEQERNLPTFAKRKMGTFALMLQEGDTSPSAELEGAIV